MIPGPWTLEQKDMPCCTGGRDWSARLLSSVHTMPTTDCGHEPHSWSVQETPSRTLPADRVSHRSMPDNSRTLRHPILDVQVPALITSPCVNIDVCAGMLMEVEREQVCRNNDSLFI